MSNIGLTEWECREIAEETERMAAHAELSEAQRERLEMLAEEAAEIIKCCTKILRHGYYSYNPSLPPGARISNRDHLEQELIEFWAVYERMAYWGEVGRLNFDSAEDVWKDKLKYTHSQPDRAPANHPPKRRDDLG